MKKLLLIAGLCLAVSGCGNARRLYVKDGICYERERTWIAGVVVETHDHPAGDQSECYGRTR